MTTKQCIKCEREYIPSSRHKKCPKCRRDEKHDLCACGKLKQVEGNQCGECRRTGPFPWHKDGKTRHKKGYVLLKIPDHPRAKNNNGYVFEHILVMEEFLGRYLLPGETVHHLYGIKDDNRIEHLELWTTPQPAGIRATDALAWAHMVIDLYETTYTE